MVKFKDVLDVVTKWENTGKVFFTRNRDSMRINIRDPRMWGGDPNKEHWPLANEVLADIDNLKVLNFGIKIDKHSCLLYIVLPNVYKLK